MHTFHFNPKQYGYKGEEKTHEVLTTHIGPWGTSLHHNFEVIPSTNLRNDMKNWLMGLVGESTINDFDSVLGKVVQEVYDFR